MKINFRNVSETMVNGDPATFHQAFANVVFNNTMDRRMADLAKEIYAGNTVDVDEDEVKKLRDFVVFKSKEGADALAKFAQRGLLEFIDGIVTGAIEHVEPPEEEVEEIIIPTEE